MTTKASVRSLADAQIEWLRTLSLSESATNAYRGEVNRLATFCATKGVLALHRLKAEHWTAYLSCLMEDRRFLAPDAKPLKPRSALQATRITRSFLLFCARRRWIDWDPAELNLGSQSADIAEEPAFTLTKLPERVRTVLTGGAQPKNLREARRNLALALAFWGALSPREIALLTVGDLHAPSGHRSCELRFKCRPMAVMLPYAVRGVWRRYRDFRTEQGQRLLPTSPLVASLREGAALQPWSVWALMHTGDEVESGGPGRSLGRLLRRAYVATTTQDAVREVNVIRSQAGLATNGVELPAASTRGRILDELHSATLVRLAYPSGQLTLNGW